MKKIIFFLIFSISLFSIENESSEKLETPPNPLELKASWWIYYDVDQERLGVRIQKTDESLKTLFSDLSPTQQELALPIIQQINIGLSSYRELTIKKVPQLVFEPRRHEQYSYHEFLEMIDHLSENELIQDSINQQVKIEKGNLKTDQSYLDTQMAAYLTASKSDPSRVIKGLKIMNRKITLEIDKKKLMLLEGRLINSEVETEEIKKEIGYARDLIDPSQINTLSLKKAIEDKKNALSQAQESLLKAQRLASQDRNLFSNENVLFFTLTRAEADLLLINAELKNLLAQILTQKERKTVKELYLNLHKLKDDDENIVQELKDWKSAANLYAELALSNENKETINLSQKIGILIQKIDRLQRKNGYLFSQAELFIRSHYTTLSDRLSEIWEILLAKMKYYSKWSHKSIFKIGETPITLYTLVKVIFIIFIAYFIAKFSQVWTRRIGKKERRYHRAGIYTLSRISYYVILIVGILIAISGTGIDFTTFAVIAGALSVGIGFGLQSIVNNFISGIILLLEKKLRIGDIIELDSKELGRVIEINVRTTLVKTFDNVEILVPNADLVSKKFINWTLSDKVRRIRIPFGVAFGTDKDKVREVIIEAAKKIPITVESRTPQVWLTKIGESSLDFELIVWVNESMVESPPTGTQAWYTWEVESALRAHNISIPFPVRDIHITKNSMN